VTKKPQKRHQGQSKQNMLVVCSKRQVGGVKKKNGTQQSEKSLQKTRQVGGRGHTNWNPGPKPHKRKTKKKFFFSQKGGWKKKG